MFPGFNFPRQHPPTLKIGLKKEKKEIGTNQLTEWQNLKLDFLKIKWGGLRYKITLGTRILFKL